MFTFANLSFFAGALQQAIEVLKHSRKKASQAIFLITDGYSNGGDPRPAAKLLKSLNVEIFTFGIRNGNVKELRDMASNPKDEHSYILDSFQEFEALARRALHEGNHSVCFFFRAESRGQYYKINRLTVLIVYVTFLCLQCCLFYCNIFHF